MPGKNAVTAFDRACDYIAERIKKARRRADVNRARRDLEKAEHWVHELSKARYGSRLVEFHDEIAQIRVGLGIS